MNNFTEVKTPNEITDPCHRCVLIAICRNKLYDDLIKDCKLLLDALYFDGTTGNGARSTYYGDKVNMIQDILKPENWEIIIDPKDSGSRVIALTCIDLEGHRSGVIIPKNFQLKKRVKAHSKKKLIHKIRERKREHS